MIMYISGFWVNANFGLEIWLEIGVQKIIHVKRYFL